VYYLPENKGFRDWIHGTERKKVKAEGKVFGKTKTQSGMSLVADTEASTAAGGVDGLGGRGSVVAWIGMEHSHRVAVAWHSGCSPASTFGAGWDWTYESTLRPIGRAETTLRALLRW
jgi:hypothetical protein